MKKILITGCAGFVGFNLSKYLLSKGFKVIGIDNLDDYYSVKLKRDRLNNLTKSKNFKFIKNNLLNLKLISKIIVKNKISNVVHLAAQAGVRLSISNPKKYFDNNVITFFNILEAGRINECKKIIFASSSSVYGEVNNKPIKENKLTNPIQFYATTKVCNEQMGKVYSKIYNMKIIGLRFFTVYGPWGRPDMAYYNFATKILKEKKIDLYNNGQHKRDFTYIDDVTNSIYLILTKNPKKNKSNYRIYNIANSNSNPLLKLVSELKKNLQKKVKINYKKKQLGDVKNTFGNSQKLFVDYGFKPNTTLQYGIKKFIEWLKDYYKVN